MRSKRIAILLIAAATLATVCCSEKEKATTVKVSRVYNSNHVKAEMFNPVTETWTTLTENTTERKPKVEFYWNGDRLDSIYAGGSIFYTTCDSKGRITKAHTPLSYQIYDIEYGSDGQMSRSIYSITDENGDTIMRETANYTWSDGKLQRIMFNHWSKEPTTSGLIKEEYQYTWKGDNVTKSVLYAFYDDGDIDTTTYDYEVANVLNPFAGFAFFQIPYCGYTGSFHGTDGLNKNMVSHIKGANSTRDYEYTTSGDRVTSFTGKTFSESGTTRITIEDTYEFEYVN